jgi:uncharacterized protein YdeI (YjbR/CyaY-like superfamily)
MGLRYPKPFPRIPADLKNAMEIGGLFERFRALAPSHRRKYLEWLIDAKKPETRKTRVLRIIKALRSVKDRS